jgi:glycosyltransferase involved in cell wall biosynthesis/SAM-dependent methyltransferase
MTAAPGHHENERLAEDHLGATHAAANHASPLVSVVTIFLDEERFIEEAVESVLAQTYPRWELLLVDDGSTDASTEIARRYAARHPGRVRYLEHPRHENRGMGASRALALEHASGEYLCFLDADDVYRPRKLEHQVATLHARPGVGLLYGATEYWHTWDGNTGGREDHVWRHFGAQAERVIQPPELLLHFLRDGGTLPCMGSVMVRCSVARETRAFDERFRGLYEDQAFLAAVGLVTPAYITPECHDRYRQHPDSTCHRADPADVQAARADFLAWLRHRIERAGIRHEGLKQAVAAAETAHRAAVARSHDDRRLRRVASLLRRARAALTIPAVPLIGVVKRWLRAPRPRPGTVRFGNLRRLTPISRLWGRDRGRPLDRYYIENFLERHRADVCGRVLEVGEPSYTRQFGGDRVERSDVLHVEEGNAHATIVADLACADHIPDDSFDCIILTQTLQMIFDVPAALRTLHRILRPNGVLLATFPGITHTGDADWQETWYWSFTANSAQRLFHAVFGEENVRIESHGNVFAATAFLYGLADHELRRDELDHHDPAFDIVITVRAQKSASR